MKRKIIAGNWKMFKTISESMDYIKEFPLEGMPALDVDVVLCPNFLSGAVLAGHDKLNQAGVYLGAQNGHWAKEGAYTGEVSMAMIAEAGCRYVIVGHSERRMQANEKDETVQKKVKAAIDNKLIPILCVGETKEERDQQKTEEVIEKQIKVGLEGISFPDPHELAVAYEPVWAIGTGEPASPQDAIQANRKIRHLLADLAGRKWAQEARILYGGSVKPENIGSFLQEDEIDGALIGGASLDPHAFKDMVRTASKRRF